jgi:uncharacterized protein YidB (DUF937 family)
MGLQDILGKLGGQAGQQGGLDNIQSLFGGNGLQGIISQLTSAGLGQQVQSWVGTGENQKVSGQQIQQAMDPAALQQMSRQTGMPADQISDHVAQALPHLVDQVTPDGEIPSRDPLSQGVSALRGMSGSR